MIHRTKQEEAFSTLSIQAQLYIKLADASSDQERFLQCVRYATDIAQRKFLGEIGKILNESLKVIMRLINSYLDSGVHPDTADHHHTPAIFHAVTNPELVKLLLTRGANPNLQNDFQSTALHWVAMFFDSYYVENLFTTAELLAAAGANITTKDDRNERPVDVIKKSFILSEDTIIKMKARFKELTEHPRELGEISTTSTEQSANADLQLTEMDTHKIRLYRDNKYDELINLDPLYNKIKTLNRITFRTSEKQRNKAKVSLEISNNASVISTRKP